MNQPSSPSRILMLKGHSAGIGDLLRSSAAWRVLKNAYPQAELHLLFLTSEPGYASEELFRDHHLLNSFTALDKRTRTMAQRRKYWASINAVAAKVRPDLVIDFEPNGLRTSLVAAWLRLRWGARTIGIRTAPGRNLFYGRAAPSPSRYAQNRGLVFPLEYAERDFVVLAALGLERGGCPIELRETEAGRQLRLSLRQKHGLAESVPLLGLNIGCGTPGAESRRPNLEMLSELVAGLERDHGMRLVLTGAPFEREINAKFIELHRALSSQAVIDLAGETNLSGLTGAISAFALFISSDSGPYHFGVALRRPTLAVFNYPSPVAYHYQPWVRCCVAPSREQLPALREAAEQLLAWNPSQAESAKSSRAVTGENKS